MDETLQRQILDKLNGIDEKITVLELNVVRNQEKVEARFQQGNDRFFLLEKRLDNLENSHEACRGDTGVQYAIKVITDNLQAINAIIAWWNGRAMLVNEGKKSAVSHLVVGIVSSVAALALAAGAYLLTHGKTP